MGSGPALVAKLWRSGQREATFQCDAGFPGGVRSEKLALKPGPNAGGRTGCALAFCPGGFLGARLCPDSCVGH